MAKQKQPTKKKAPARSVDIFKILGQIDRQDREYYDRLEEHEQKQLHPLVLMRWLSGVNDPNVIRMLNVTVNPYIFNLANHKPLLMRMLQLASCGRVRRYQWSARAKEKNKNKHIEVVKQYYECTAREAALHAQHHTVEDVAQMARELGYQDDEVKQLIK